MSFTVSGQPITAWVLVTANTQTTVLTASKKTTVVSMNFKHTGAGTPNLTVLRNDGTNDHYFRNAEAISAAKETVTFDEVFTLGVGDTLKVTSSAVAGDFACRITYLAPDAGANR